MRMVKLGAVLAAIVWGATPVAAQKSADTLRIAMRDALPNIDPYYNNLRTGVITLATYSCRLAGIISSWPMSFM